MSLFTIIVPTVNKATGGTFAKYYVECVCVLVLVNNQSASTAN